MKQKNILKNRSNFNALFIQLPPSSSSPSAMLLICLYWALFTPLVSVHSRVVLLTTRSYSQKGACEYMMPILFLSWPGSIKSCVFTLSLPMRDYSRALIMMKMSR